MDAVTPDKKNISEILKSISNSPLMVPLYQREYSWEEEDVELLINDLFQHYKHCLKNSDWKEYYCGTIIIHRTNNARNIVDGQQRLTTITVIACALLDIITHVTDNATGINGSSEIIDDPEGVSGQKGLTFLGQELTSLIHEPGFPDKTILQLKQLDQERLEWIRKGINKKSDELCFETFEWRKGKGSHGLPGMGSSTKLKRIYLTYMKVWELFGKYGEGSDGWKDIGILENKSVLKDGEMVPEKVWPFSNRKKFSPGKDDKYKLKKWSLIEQEKQLKNTLNRIQKISYAIRTLASPVQITVKEQWLAYQIFDRSNNAGRQLAMIDVIRAKAFGALENFEPNDIERQALGNEFQKIYDKKPSQTDINYFIKHYASVLKQEKVTGQIGLKVTFEDEIKKLSSKTKVNDWVEKLVNSFGIYYSVFIEAKNDDYGNTTKYNETFEITKFRQHRPIILKAMIEELDDDEVVKLLQCCESIYIIHRIINSSSPSEIESLMGNTIEHIVKGSDASNAINKLKDAYKETKTFKDNKLNKTEFKEELKKSSFSNEQGQFVLRNMICKSIIDEFNTNTAGGTKPMEMSSIPPMHDPKNLNLEHILPQSPKKWGSKWFKENKPTEKHENYCYRIGNMILLKAEYNAKIKNDTFDEKIKFYKKADSGVRDKKLKKKTKWGEKGINNRSERVAEFMEKWWIF